MFRVIFAAAALALTALWLFVWRAPMGAGNWYLSPNEAAWPVGAWLLSVGVVAIFGGAATLSVYDRFKRAKGRKEQTNSTITALVCLAIIGLLWPWALLGPGQIQSRSGGAIAEGTVAASRPTLEGRFNIIAALWSDVATEYFGAAYTFDDARAYTRTYAQTQQNPQSRVQAHVATHPPGAVLWFYGVRKTYESSPVLQRGLNALAQTMTGQTPAESAMLARKAREAPAVQGIGPSAPPPLPDSAVGAALLAAILLGASLVAAIPAIYGLAALGGGANGNANAERRGVVAVGLWILAPTTHLFAFTLDALVACGAAWTLYFAALAWHRASLVRPTARAEISEEDANSAGAEEKVLGAEDSPSVPAQENPDGSSDIAVETGVTSASKFASLWWIASGIVLALTTFLSIGALAVGAILLGALALYRPRGGGRALLLLGGAFVGVWAVLAMWGGFNPLEIALNAGRAHRFATLETRDYWPWVALNLGFWALFIGWPVVALLAGGVKLYKESARSARGIAGLPARNIAPALCLGIATLGVLVLLTLSGNVRGETERLWLFALAPVCALAASDERMGWRWWALLLLLQALQTLLMAATLAPLVRPF